MHRLAASALVTFACLTVAASQLPCDSQLRLSPAFSHLFTHCDCSFSEWTVWTAIRTRPVPLSQCPSGKALEEERRQRVVSGNCDEKQEERVVCEPEVIDRLILGLGLGSTGQQIAPGGPARRPGRPGPIAGVPPPPGAPGLPGLLPALPGLPGLPGLPELPGIPGTTCSGPQQVCQHVTTPHGKRSVRSEMKRPRINRRRSAPEPEPLPINPTPFNVLEHGARYRRQVSCQPDGIQHILFVLDTSGSVSESEFNQVTSVLSDLVLFFCKPIKIAVMTFDHEYFVEFCFNCFENTCSGRQDMRDAFLAIVYGANRSGTRYTHTGGAAQCVCDVILTPSCGLDPAATCVDVVFVTDGHSNDPNRDVCEDILCLHNRFGVNTFALGIEFPTANIPELECIADNDNNLGSNGFHLFNFPSFDEFEEIFQELVEVLLMGASDPNGDPYVCIDPQEGVGTVSCDQ